MHMCCSLSGVSLSAIKLQDLLPYLTLRLLQLRELEPVSDILFAQLLLFLD